MKRLWLITPLFLVLLSNIHNAAAFWTNQNANKNTDGLAKFAGPDEQTSGFMVTLDDAGARGIR